MSTENHRLVVPAARGIEDKRPSVTMVALHLQRALDFFANGIWCTTLVSLVIGPPLLVVLSTMEIMRWWDFAGQAL